MHEIYNLGRYKKKKHRAGRYQNTERASLRPWFATPGFCETRRKYRRTGMFKKIVVTNPQQTCRNGLQSFTFATRLIFKFTTLMNPLGKIVLGLVAGVAAYQILKIRSVRNSLVDALVDGSVYVIKRKLLK
jgi:hypothetical protein